MYGNGVRTGMEATAVVRRLTLQDHHLALSVFFAVVLLTIMRVVAEYRIVTA